MSSVDSYLHRSANMTAPLLRIPPFPNAPRQSLAQPGLDTGLRLSDEELDGISHALAKAKVGGTYWGEQPPLPPLPYILIKVADPDVQADAITRLRPDRPVVSWVDTAGKSCRGGTAQHYLVRGTLDPWHLISRAVEVIVEADDELVLLAAVAGVPVTCIGNGRFASLNGGRALAVRDAIRQWAAEGVRYTNPFTGAALTVTEAIELCGFWRKLIDSNRDISTAVGFAFWKRPTVAPLLWNGTSGPPFVTSPRPSAPGDKIAIWKTRTDPATLANLEASDADLIEVEDGFIRSTGLGADCVPPLSIIVDRLGAYFDPNRPSELEQLLQAGDFNADILDRAKRLRALIVELGVSKYGAGTAPIERTASARHLLVPGQVEDDRSVMCGGGAVTTNLELLRRVRDGNPDAHIIYKPHPDVEAGHRSGTIPDELCLTLAQDIVRKPSISSLIDLVDEVHVNTSLAGFEALLRGKTVTTYGVPFYAGWRLTRDLGSIPPRRTARRTLDELVAATLLLYPRYLDPVTCLPCPPEILMRRLSEGAPGRKIGPVIRLRRLQGRVNLAVAKILAR